MLKTLLLAAVFSLSLSASPSARAPEVAKVSALRNGALLLNGRRVDLARIEAEFKRLKKAKGEVWYYREGPNSEPSPNAQAVIRLVVDNGLPVQLSTKPDFSDYVDGEGKSHPRKRPAR